MLPASVIILAGGKSSRMGENKAHIKLGEEHSLLNHAISVFKPIFQEVIVSSNEPMETVPAKVVSDIFRHQGPLGGMHACLKASNNEFNFVVACDMPFIEVELAKYMVSQAPGYDAVVPHLGKHYEPLFAVYAKSCIKPIEECLVTQQNKITYLFDKIKVKEIFEHEVNQYTHLEYPFFNVNTREDLVQARLISKGVKKYE